MPRVHKGLAVFSVAFVHTLNQKRDGRADMCCVLFRATLEQERCTRHKAQGARQAGRQNLHALTLLASCRAPVPKVTCFP